MVLPAIGVGGSFSLRKGEGIYDLVLIGLLRVPLFVGKRPGEVKGIRLGDRSRVEVSI